MISASSTIISFPKSYDQVPDEVLLNRMMAELIQQASRQAEDLISIVNRAKKEGR